jgi:hypothetical protein
VVLVGWCAEGRRRCCTSDQSSCCQGVCAVLLYKFPLIIVYQEIIKFAAESYVGHRTGQNVPPIGLGIGLTFVLLALQVIASLGTHHFFYRSASTGILLRGGLINAIYNRSLRLTSRARSTLTNGKLVNHISTDVSRIDFCAGFFHAVRIISGGYLSPFLLWTRRHGLPQFR